MDDVLTSGVEQDLYPKTEAEHQAWVSRVEEMFLAADGARRTLEDRWKRFYRLWRSYVKRGAGDWRSKVFLPHTFFIIDTLLPRATASLPQFLAKPVGPEDVEPARVLEDLMNHCADRSHLSEQLVYAWLDAFVYGTGILKTKVVEESGMRLTPMPQMQPMSVPMPMMDPSTGQAMNDVDGQPMMEDRQIGMVPMMGPDGQPQMDMAREDTTLYRGPAAESVDPFNFWVAPEATSVEDARYVIQRFWRSRSYVEGKIRDGVWRRPPQMAEGEFGEAIDEPNLERLRDIGVGGSHFDPTRKAVEVLEIWTDDLVVTVANRKMVLRVAENPYMHQEKPYIRLVDHPVAHEFWGIGEVEVVEGLQDLLNALVNQRVDNVRLLLNAMFIIDEDAVKDLRDLQIRPGGVIRAKDARAVGLDALVKRLDMGEVTGSSFEEAAEAERVMEKISGVNSYTAGYGATDYTNQTATGAAIMSDQGNARFTQRSRFAELTAYKRLAKHYGTLMQQFMPPEMVLRIEGPQGGYSFVSLDPMSIAGGFDFDVEAESTTTTETIRREQAMSLFQLLAADPMVNHQALVEDLLRGFGHKDVSRYAAPMPVLPPTMGGAPPLGAGGPAMNGQPTTA